jgi:hypothetical protein
VLVLLVLVVARRCALHFVPTIILVLLLLLLSRTAATIFPWISPAIALRL